MASHPPRRVLRDRAPRGVSLIEGMTASVVLLIGLVGVFQGILVASRQNSMANQATRASGIAAQVRVALDTQGRDRTLAMLSGAACDPSDAVKALAGGLEKLKPGGSDPWKLSCIFDLDAYEKKAGNAMLMPSYPEGDFAQFRRIVVVVEGTDAVTGVPTHDVSVVVSWPELARRRFVRQYFGFYDPGPFGNETNVEI